MLLINLYNSVRCFGTKSLPFSRHTHCWRNIAVAHEALTEKINVVRNKHNTTVEPSATLPQSAAFMFGYKSIY